MKKQNRVIALLLCLCLLFGLIPTSAFAIDWLAYDVEITLDNYKAAKRRNSKMRIVGREEA